MKTIKQSTIDKILVRMGIKPVAIMNEPKKTLIMHGKLLPKTEVKEAVKPKPQPKKRVLKPVATKVVTAQQIEVDKLLETDPAAALALGLKFSKENKERKLKAMAYANLTDEERDRVIEKANKIKMGTDALTKNLPSFTWDVNFRHELLFAEVVRLAFNSALNEDILFNICKDGQLYVRIGATNWKIDKPKEQLGTVNKKLIDYSGVSFGKEYDAFKLYHALIIASANYASSQRKLKTSEWYLEEFVSKASQAELKFTSDKSGRNEVRDAFVLAASTLSIEIGFRTNKNRTSVFIDSSDNRFGLAEISVKEFTGYVVRAVEAHNYSTKLSGDSTQTNIAKSIVNNLNL